MLWTFHRLGQQFHYEIHHTDSSSGFELVLYHPGGRHTCERFSNADALNQRVMELQESLVEDGWFVTSNSRR